MNLNNFEATYLKGIYYNPANSKYEGNGQVNCDKCMKSNISSCISYSCTDLCLECCTLIEKEFSEKIKNKNKNDNKFFSVGGLTRMEQFFMRN